MGAFALDLDQTKTLRFGEFGVSLDHLDSEGDLIDDALSGTVTAGEEFQVLDTVVLPIAVNVVDGFVRVEFATDVLRHDEAVLENAFLSASDARGNGNNHVPSSFFVPFKTLSSFESRVKPGQSGGALVFRFAALTAKFLLCVVLNAAHGVVFLSRHCLPALKASEDLLFFVPCALSFARALRGAVTRIFVKLLTVRGKSPRLHKESAIANFASESDRLHNGRRATVRLFVSQAARVRTVFFLGFARLYLKSRLAVLASFLNGHGDLLLVEKRIVAVSVI